ncbi:hypothetical protein SISNIDRAFT_454959 [Sistotremastrum niveocremeum HHB9708]|uniref:F-box domain-containing protein n=1 Tax=Sistotremastrum niveocremeum HHB9708 TaxID=1314777 RepID=A0A164U8C7_9AGAM|nr:hypothetical protein SISNIDRAFT_454959 [Sistotremastrum niveocremeum HHB9708]
MSSTTELVESDILLTPRPYALVPSKFILVPLLPEPKQLPKLPAETWHRILAVAFDSCDRSLIQDIAWERDILLVNKLFNTIATPLFFAHPLIRTLDKFIQFSGRINSRERKPRALDRIPYSTPGRWVHVLDLSKIPCQSGHDASLIDDAMANLFPALPFLSTLLLNQISLSRRTIKSLIGSPNSAGLRTLCGMRDHAPSLVELDGNLSSYDDPILDLLRNCTNLEHLDLVGNGVPDDEMEIYTEEANIPTVEHLHLPNLRVLSLRSISSSGLFLALASSPLPSLRSLTLSPYGSLAFPASLAPLILANHGGKLLSLRFDPQPSFPPSHHQMPSTVLQSCPNLTYLSLANPLPMLHITQLHPLQCLSVPKPTPTFLKEIERVLPYLQNLKFVRLRETRWLPSTMNSHARATGLAGEMGQWKRRLGARGITVLDANGRISEW